MTFDEAVKTAESTEAPLSKRLEAHAFLMRDSIGPLPDRFQRYALADICTALTRIGAR